MFGGGELDLYSSLLFSGRNETRHSKRNLYHLLDHKNNVAPFVFIKRDILLIPTMQRNFHGDDRDCFISQFWGKNTYEPFSYFVVIAYMAVRYNFFPYLVRNVAKGQKQNL